MAEPNGEHGLNEKRMDPEFNLADPRKQLERGLKSRHIQFLALGTKIILTSKYQELIELRWRDWDWPLCRFWEYPF
jgi:hypothetical protein